MRYGYFDDSKKEYVIERPDTPKGWINYSGSRNYGSVITNNAGGYSFYRSPAYGRFLRFWHNAIPYDQPGRYLYLRDDDDGDYWSGSWQPVGKPLDKYETTCRFGTQYTVIKSIYAEIESETTYFVPLNQNFEYWKVKITNNGSNIRNLSLYTYIEFSSEWNFFQDHFNLQYSGFIVKTKIDNGIAECSSLGNLPVDKENFANGDQGRWSWITLAGTNITGYELDREAFIGPYRSYNNPQTVENGVCGNTTAFGDNGCGSLQTKITLQPGESKEFVVMMGIGKGSEEGARIKEEYGTLEKAEEELTKLKDWCHSRLGFFTVNSPDENFNHMINVWNAYNCLMTFNWSRSCSLIYTGEGRDALGYRDTVQDLMGVTHAIPEEARERMELMITGQNSTGGAMPEIKPYAHLPGKMPQTKAEDYRSDDCLWLFNAIPNYVAETGDVDFYKKILPYSDKGEGTVFEHLKSAIEFNLNRTGVHGLPCGLKADWNDCLKLGFNGESLFVTFQLRLALKVYAEIASLLNENAEEKWAIAEMEKLDIAIQTFAWDGEWFKRAFREDGTVLGSNECEEGKIFLNSQSWAIISGAATDEQATKALDSVNKLLATEHGIMLCWPPYIKESHKVVRAVLFNPGQKENGGLFSQIQPWAVMAETLLGHGDRAYQYYNAFMPARYNDIAEIRKIEPFVHCQSTSSPDSEKFGTSHVPWLSGTAAWAYFAGTQHILGVKPSIDGISIDPCVPSTWTNFTMQRIFRGKKLNITVDNSNGVQHGVISIVINNELINGSFISINKIQENNDILVKMG